MFRSKADHFIGLLFTILFLLLAGCVIPQSQSKPGSFPTPTNSEFINRSGAQEIVQLAENRGDKNPIPTVASLFGDYRTDILPTTTNQPPVASDRPRPTPANPTKLVSVYNEGLNSNWMIQRTPGLEINLASSYQAKSGDVSLAVTPKEGNSILLFAVKENSTEVYRRDEVLGLSFWLYSGDEILDTDALAVTVLGSNAYPYWVINDNSVKSAIQPVFSETRLYFLGLNRSVPPNTWVLVELWLKDRIYDPDYTYVTGFYIKNDSSVTNRIFIDDVELIMVESENNATSGPLTGAFPGLANVGRDSTSNSLMPVWSVQVDVNREVHPISPLIYGATITSNEVQQALRLTLNSWGGNPITRYNWKLGHAWNAGRDFFFKNGNYGVTEGSASDMFLEDALKAGAEVRLAIPTLGWVAKNDDLNTCSFPLPDGTCSDVPEAKCENPTIIADPNRTSVPSDVNFIREWMLHLFEERGFDIRFIAMDNEPELWGYTHYDVHPKCTTYQEILDKFLEYATMVREVAPEVEITGPVTSGWWHYWNSAAGMADKLSHGNQDFLPWFLDSAREYEKKNGVRILDVLDIHYYPQRVYNAETDQETATLRLRSTRSLWDPGYVDESWINAPVFLIPRMKQLIEEHYPGTRLGISEWNWGAEMTMNGSLAIADVLGIFGREDLYFASYFSFPPLNSPGFFAFKMYTNYDSEGSRFGDTSVWAQTTDADVISSFASIDSKTGKLTLILINKQPDSEIPLQVYLKGFIPEPSAERYQYSQTQPTSISKSFLEITADTFDITLPAYSITLIVLEPRR